MSNDVDVSSMLRVGTVLHGAYRIDCYLSSGGFGNTYVATHVELGKRVAIKEFCCRRPKQKRPPQTKDSRLARKAWAE